MQSGDVMNVVENPQNTPLGFERYFTKDNHVLKDFGINFVSRTAHIENYAGKVIFHQDDVIVPDFWSQTAVNILAQKYFKKVGVPNAVRLIFEAGVPHAYARSIPGVSNENFTGENSLKQVAYRLVGHWIYIGFKNGYFLTEGQADIVFDELRYMLYTQMAAPNSPQFFNTGLYWAYGITGNANNDHYAGAAHTLDAERTEHCYREGDILKVNNSYAAPQIHACFINQVEDKLIGPDGIMDLFTKEARIFKYGSGSGCNYSAIRGKDEPLSGGGFSSGLLSFLKIGDTVGGAIKSGGTTRRASRCLILDDNHPDLLDFIQWKTHEEDKARALIEGSKLINSQESDFPVYNSAFEGEAYTTITGQNANNSVNVSNDFMAAAQINSHWYLIQRTGGIAKTINAQYYLKEMAKAAWKCGDPGIFFGDNINEWNTCPVDETISATNPCFEYLWFSNTACNLASLNLLRFYSNETFDIEGFKHAVALWTTVLDISISMAGYPSEVMAKKSFEYRTLGLGYTNLGALLMVMGVPYNSDAGRELASDITVLMTGQAYATSAKLASYLGAFPAYERNKEFMFSVLQKHASAYLARGTKGASDMSRAIFNLWTRVLDAESYRNAQVTLLAPTGTISFIMDAQTTGVEPDFALVKHKELAGGGNIKLINQSIVPALYALGYEGRHVNSIIEYVLATGSIKDCPLIDRKNYDIFACANDISPAGHLMMLAAIQPFVSGGISKTINLPNSASIEDVKNVFISAWKLGLKCISIYRDGCKASQPLTVQKNLPKDENPSGDEVIASIAHSLDCTERDVIQYAHESVRVPGYGSLTETFFGVTEEYTFTSEDIKFHEAVAVCPTCGHQMSVQIGVCHLCPVCGATTGCS